MIEKICFLLVVWKQLKERYIISKRISVYNIVLGKDFHNVKIPMMIKKELLFI